MSKRKPTHWFLVKGRLIGKFNNYSINVIVPATSKQGALRRVKRDDPYWHNSSTDDVTLLGHFSSYHRNDAIFMMRLANEKV